MVTIRKAKESDVGRVSEVYDSARRFMRSRGNDTQWIGGYPSVEDIRRDIEAGTLYVGENSEGRVVMAFAFIPGTDPTYLEIDGRWLNDEPYGTIHRIASDGSERGMLKLCVGFCFGLADNIRIDTHKDNAVMLELLRAEGFERCGVIICRDGTPREAFHKKKLKA